MDYKIELCEICGKNIATETHHLLFGYGIRPLADADKIYISICSNCHTMGKKSIHDNETAGKLSKMAGQYLWERNYILERVRLELDKELAENIEESARNAFIKRYGRSWV